MRSPLLWLLVLTLPFFLNDLLFWAAEGAVAWLAVDYIFKIAVLFMVIIWLKSGGTLERLGLCWPGWRLLIVWSVALSVLGVAINQLVYDQLAALGGGWRLFGFPAIENRALEIFDLSFGLMLTAVSEELVFRGALVLGLLALWPSKTGVVVISSLIFGLIHWGLGPAVVVTAALWGILPAISVLLMRSIYPAIIAHYVTNFVDFSGLF